MPQRLIKLVPDLKAEEVNLDENSIAVEGPASLLPSAMYIINLASYLDMWLALIFAEMTDSNATTTVAMLNAIQSIQAKISIINAGAKTVLTDEEFRLFGAIATIARGCLRERNRLAHGLWGTYKSLPDALILLDAEHFVTPNAKIKELFAKGVATDAAGMERFEVFKKNAYVYRMDEFNNLAKRFQFALSVSKGFHFMLQAPEPVKLVKRRELEAFPQIQSILSSQNDQKQLKQSDDEGD